MAGQDMSQMTGKDLLAELDSALGGCEDPECIVCTRRIATIKEIAKRLGVDEFKPWLETMRERGQR